MLRISRGKYERLTRLLNDKGILVATAMDQRGSLRKALGKTCGRNISIDELQIFKQYVVEELSESSSAVLLDPEYGWKAAEKRPKNTGLLMAYEKTGYDETREGRLPELLPNWSVQRLAERGVDAVKLLVYYDPDDAPSINDQKHAIIERVGAECAALDIVFFLEPVTYSHSIMDTNSCEYAKVKPDKVKACMREFSKPKYRIDFLKVEAPVNMRFVEGSKANDNSTVLFTKKEALQHFRDTALLSDVPFIYLSGGVEIDVFIETLEYAAEAGVPFSGVLCGRATWQEGISAYGMGGKEKLRDWLHNQGINNLKRLYATLERIATPWWDFYGGRDKIEIVE